MIRGLEWILVLAAVLCSSSVGAYVVTFDDVPTGLDLSRYYERYGLNTSPGWAVVDGVASGWGTPHSGAQTLMWAGHPTFGPVFGFGVDGVSEYTVRSVGAFFSTQLGATLEMQGFCRSGAVVTTQVGEAGGAWSNHYAHITSAAGDILFVAFAGVGGTDLPGAFVLDDLAIEPVPEPSSVSALAYGLAGLGGLVLRRRRV